jgi:ABC-type Fe3+ transport system substrate-binding protein
MDATETNTIIELEEEQQGSPERPDFLGYPPCAFKHTFKEGIDGVLGMHRKNTGNILKGYFPEGCDSGSSDPYGDIWRVTQIDHFPDVVASMGFGDFFRKDFVERFVRKGHFKSVWDGPVNEPFEGAGFRDPDGWYTIYAVMPFVMLIDKKKLGNLQAPRHWRDLLELEFQGNVIIPGGEGHIVDALLLYFFKEHGLKGITMLAANVRRVWHPARMAGTAGTSNPEGAAVYVLPWFFAHSCPKTDATSIVWPEDGALANPMYLLVKESRRKEVSAIVEYITGPDLGRKSADSFFPVLNPLVQNRLPEGALFKWLGWDYIKSHDPAELRDSAYTVFVSAWKEAQKGGNHTGGMYE